MESDDSFAWTGASSDSGDSAAAAGAIGQDNKYKEESDNGFKRKLQKQLLQERVQRDLCNGELRKRKTKKTREAERGAARVKAEPESSAQDDAYLELRVKQERTASTPPPAPPQTPAHSKNKKKDKRDAKEKKHLEQENECLDTTNNNKSKKLKRYSGQDETMNGEEFDRDARDVKQEISDFESPRGKKRKSKGKHSDITENDIKDMIIEDMFSAEETVVETRHTTPNHTAETTTTKPNSTRRTDAKHSNSFELNSKQSRKSVKDSSYSYTSKEFVSEDSSSISDTTTGNTRVRKRGTTRSPTGVRQRATRDSSDSDSQHEGTNERSAAKLSDRLRFEDDDTAEGGAAGRLAVAVSARFRRFLNSNTHLSPALAAAAAPLDGGGSILTKDDEVWLLKCPREVDIISLQDRDLQLDSKCKLKVDGHTYDGTLETDTGMVAFLSLEHSTALIKNIPLIGTINFRKRIPKVHFVEDNIIANNQTNFIPLPLTICRHPLFGSDYKRRIKVSTSVRARLNATEQHLPERKKKKKHARRPSAPPSPAPAPLPPPAASKKRRHRHAEAEADADAPPHKKVKRLKREPEPEDAWESEKAIQENLFSY